MSHLHVNADDEILDLDLDQTTPELVLVLPTDQSSKRIRRVELGFRTTADLTVGDATAKDVTVLVRDGSDTDHEVQYHNEGGVTSQDYVWEPEVDLELRGENKDQLVIQVGETADVTARVKVYWERTA